MNLNHAFEIKSYDFNSNLHSEFQNSHYAKDLWPIVYILSDGNTKEAYVGETTDTYARMNSHLKSNAKNKLTTVHLIASEKFNKSATLDIESNLIKYISGDGQYKLINGNVGLANHNYYQKKEVYWDMFKSIWDRLRAEGISKHSIDYIDNSDLFKYSPYKTLTHEQKSGLLVIIKNLLNGDFKNIIVEGGAGTGKTILAIFLFKLLNSNNEDFNFKEFGDDESEFIRLIIELKLKYPNPKMALVVPMSSFRNTLKKVFKNIKGLSANMVIGPAEIIKDKFNIVIVDESHRLRRRVNLGAYYGAFDIVCEKLGLDKNNCSELDWVTRQADNAILFYDEDQSIKPSDVKKEDFDKLKLNPLTKIEYLKSQFRVKGGNDYVQYIDNLLNCKLESTYKKFDSKDYEFVLFDSIEDIVQEIKLRDKENGLSRLVAGYSWEWISNKNKDEFDIKIDDIKLKWNTVAVDWVNSINAVNEVGCIHTTQGYDLNYAGIIFGNEITYDKETDEIVILKENYFDKNGKQSINNPTELKDFILNIYKTIMLRGIKGTYIYVCDKNLREYFANHIPKFKTEKTIEYLQVDKVIPFENSIPLYDLKAAAGNFSELQNVSDYEWISLPARYKPSEDLFACTVQGESMNKVIPNGSVCLFRKYTGGSREGRIVLVEHNSIQDPDFGSGYTVKEYRSKKNIENDKWSHYSITLKPLSMDSEFKDIELVEDELSSLKVIGVFECVL
ncbi:MAG TPA: DNA/RNA helicase domain-containing protein [Flavobacterium sp.]|uniref:DNA/RNA helicase domain-containing protein n=1 Tax=Flavobacterium sp. TaxID=239 RepID=UPI002CBF4F67|nr:DNA/RNA helicase domain-containing protein [Flavobacterium sp.]HSD15583.1 DNA/RNA helicase domain-containing protein [Flavobacterium sp.]